MKNILIILFVLPLLITTKVTATDGTQPHDSYGSVLKKLRSISDKQKQTKIINDYVSKLDSCDQQIFTLKQNLTGVDKDLETAYDKKCQELMQNNKKKCDADNFDWIICGAAEMLGGVADGTFGMLNGFLKNKQEYFNRNKEPGSNVFKIWETIKNIFNILLVLAFMIIIFSQLTNYGISNYGIKKILPKFLMVIIMINLSYFLCQIAVDLSNITGDSVQNLFQGFENIMISGVDNQNLVGSGQFTNVIFAIFAVKFVGGSALFVLIAPLIVSFILIVLVTLIMLMVKDAILIILVSLSPLAFLALIFPQTNKIFETWKKLFAAILLIYPLTALLFGAGSIVGSIMESTGNQLLAMLIQVMPLVFLPQMVQKTIASVPIIGQKITGALNWANKNGNRGFKNSKIMKNSENKFKNRMANTRLNKGGGPIGRVYGGITRAYRKTKFAQKYGSGAKDDYELQQRNTNAAADAMTATDRNLISSGKYDTKDLSDNLQGVLSSTGMNQDQLEMSLGLSKAKNGELTGEEYGQVLDKAGASLNDDQMHRYNNDIFQAANAKGSYDVAGMAANLRSNNAPNWSSMKNINNRRHAIDGFLSKQDADSLSKINPKFFKNTENKDLFKNMIDSSDAFYNTAKTATSGQMPNASTASVDAMRQIMSRRSKS